METKKDTLVMDAVKLFVITLIAGTLLGLVYQVTKQPIKDANLRAKQEAYEKVFAKAKSFEESDEFSNWSKMEQEVAYVEEILEAKDAQGKLAGYVLSFVSTQGYGGEIKLSMGVSLDGTITGLEVLSMSETAGLGAKCKDDDFLVQFSGIQSSEITYTKMGKQNQNEIDAIGGATITTKAVTDAVNYALSYVYTNAEIKE